MRRSAPPDSHEEEFRSTFVDGARWSVRRLSVLLMACVVVLTGCFQEAEPLESQFTIGVRMHVLINGAPVADGVWSRDVEMRFGATDASVLSVQPNHALELDGVGAAFAYLETGLIENDESNLGFCLADDLVVVDRTQDLEYVLAEAGYCFRGSRTFTVQVEFEEEWVR